MRRRPLLCHAASLPPWLLSSFLSRCLVPQGPQALTFLPSISHLYRTRLDLCPQQESLSTGLPLCGLALQASDSQGQQECGRRAQDGGEAGWAPRTSSLSSSCPEPWSCQATCKLTPLESWHSAAWHAREPSCGPRGGKQASPREFQRSVHPA